MKDMEENEQKNAADAKKYALRILGMRDYSEHELRKKLSERYPPEVCGEAVEWLSGLGYINDREYAEKLLRRFTAKCWGHRKIRHELCARGITGEIAEGLILGIDGVDENLAHYIRKKYGSGPFDRNERSKIINALMRRGFDCDDIIACLSGFAETEEAYD